MTVNRVLRAPAGAPLDPPRRSAPSSGRRVTPEAVSRAEAEADAIRTRAEARAAGIVEAAEAEAEAIRARAREAGHADGLAGCIDVAEGFRAERARLLADQETPLLRLAVRIAERVLDAELRSDPETLRGIVRDAIRPVAQADVVRVRVHPSDASTVEEVAARLARETGAGRIEVEADDAFGAGCCRVESPLGTVEVDLPDQLRAVERALLAGGGR